MKINQKKGFIILLLTISVLILSFSACLVFFNGAFSEYQAASHQANRVKAKYLAQSGLEAALLFINKLEKFGFFTENNRPYPIPLGEDIVQFQAEDMSGKFSINQLVNLFDDTPNGDQRQRFIRLSEQLKISPDLWDAVIDWIDENNTPEPYGYERTHYEGLRPPREIKNGIISSLEELLLIPGFSRNILFSDIRTEDEKEEFEDFLGLEEESELVSEEDFILANNIAYELPAEPVNKNEFVNINSAPYLVILSLHEGMTPETVKSILIERKKLKAEGNKLDREKFKNIPGVPEDIFQDGEGGSSRNDLSSPYAISYESNLYKIIASAVVGSQIAQVAITYDKRENDVIDYTE